VLRVAMESGFGSLSAFNNPPPAAGRAGDSAVRYDPANPVQLVGNGRQFDARQVARLTDEERRALQGR